MTNRMDYRSEVLAKTYVASRELPAETVSQWLDAIAKYTPATPELAILDVGCGTGRFTQPLAHRFNARAIGIDPAPEMLKEAQAQAATVEVYYACARAEALPVRDSSMGLVFLSMVYHHLADREAALHEIRRVLHSGGRLIIRHATEENIEQLEWLLHFPEARQLDLTRMPTRREMIGELETAGLRPRCQETITQIFAATYAEYYRKIAMRSLSGLRLMSDKAFEAGLRRMRAWCEQRWQDGPVREAIDLFVAEKV